jgi:putative transposase
LPTIVGEGRMFTMARRRHTPEQIVRKLKEADRMLNEGSDVAAVARHLQVTESHLSPVAQPVRRHEGRRRQARLKELEKENSTLKRMVADRELEILALREIASGKW